MAQLGILWGIRKLNPAKSDHSGRPHFTATTAAMSGRAGNRLSGMSRRGLRSFERVPTANTRWPTKMNSLERCGWMDNFGTACGLPDGDSGNHAGQGTTRRRAEIREVEFASTQTWSDVIRKYWYPRTTPKRTPCQLKTQLLAVCKSQFAVFVVPPLSGWNLCAWRGCCIGLR